MFPRVRSRNGTTLILPNPHTLSNENKINVAHPRKCFFDIMINAERLRVFSLEIICSSNCVNCQSGLWLTGRKRIMASMLGRLLIQSCYSTPDSSLFLYPLALGTSIHAGLPVIKPPLVYKRHWRVTEEKQPPLSWHPVAVALWIPINMGCILKQYITIQQVNCSHAKSWYETTLGRVKKKKKHTNLSQRGKYILSQKQKRGWKLQNSTIKTLNMLQKCLFFSFDLFFDVSLHQQLQQIKNTVWI